jgi:polar amino acid transport system substrate-binding protein
VLIPDLYIQTFLKSAAGADYEVKLEVPKNTTLGEGVAYAIRKGDADTLTKIDTALAELGKDGTTQKLVDKWIFNKK